MDPALLLVEGFVDGQNIVKLPALSVTSEIYLLTSSSPHTNQQFLGCRLNKAHKCYPSICQIYTIRRALMRNLLFDGGMCNMLGMTPEIVKKLLKQLVTELTDQVTATQPCTVCFTQTGYRVYQPSPFNSILILGQVDRKCLQRNCFTRTAYRAH